MSAQSVRAGSAFVELYADSQKLVQGLKMASARIKAWTASAQTAITKASQKLSGFGKGMMTLGKIGFAFSAAFGGGLFAVMKTFEDSKDDLIDPALVQSVTDYSDAMQTLRDMFREVAITIGAALAPELTNLAKWLTAILQKVIKFVDANKEFIVWLAKAAAVLAGVSAGLILAGGLIWGFGTAIGVLGTIATATMTAIAGIIGIVAAALSFLLTPIGLVTAAVTGIGGYFLYEFGIIGDGIEYLRQSFGSLFNTATKSWQGIQDALAAGRLDLVFKVAWTAIRLVWADGVNFLYKQWLWLQNIVLTTWNDTVFGLSGLLIKGWAGLETFWYDSLHGIEAAWAILAKGIGDTWSVVIKGLTDAWDWAYTQIAKGLAWIYAKLTGMDAAEMVRIVEEDHVIRQGNRNKNYNDSKQARDDKYNADMTAIGDKNAAAHDRIEADKTGSLDALNSAYNSKQESRKSAYDKELEDMEADRLAAETAFNDAVKEAADVRAQFKVDKEVEKVARRAQDETVDIAQKEIKTSSTGTFNAAVAQSLQSQGPMDRIARNTEDTAKYVKKSYEKQNIAVAAGG